MTANSSMVPLSRASPPGVPLDPVRWMPRAMARRRQSQVGQLPRNHARPDVSGGLETRERRRSLLGRWRPPWAGPPPPPRPLRPLAGSTGRGSCGPSPGAGRVATAISSREGAGTSEAAVRARARAGEALGTRRLHGVGHCLTSAGRSLMMRLGDGDAWLLQRGGGRRLGAGPGPWRRVG